MQRIWGKSHTQRQVPGARGNDPIVGSTSDRVRRRVSISYPRTVIWHRLSNHGKVGSILRFNVENVQY